MNPSPLSTAFGPVNNAPLNLSSGEIAEFTSEELPPNSSEVSPPQRLLLKTSTCVLIVTESLNTSCGVKRNVVSAKKMLSLLLPNPIAFACDSESVFRIHEIPYASH